MRKALAIAAIVTAAAACGGGGTATSDTIPAAVRDQLDTDVAVVQATDLTSSFSLAASAESRGDDASDSMSGAAATCLQTEDAKTALAVRRFVTGSEIRHTVLLGEVESHTDASSLTGKLSAFTSSALGTCMNQFVSRLFAAEGGVVGDVVVTPSKFDADLDEQAGFVVTISVSEESEVFTIGVEILLGRVDRYRATTTVVAFDKPPDHTAAIAAMQAMATRLRLL